jgi:hypothetical protein
MSLPVIAPFQGVGVKNQKSLILVLKSISILISFVTAISLPVIAPFQGVGVKNQKSLILVQKSIFLQTPQGFKICSPGHRPG